MINVAQNQFGWYIDNKALMKHMLIDLVSNYARKQGIKCTISQDGTIGKYTTIGKVKINLRKHSIGFGDFYTTYWDLVSFDIQNFLLLITTKNSSIAIQLT